MYGALDDTRTPQSQVLTQQRANPAMHLHLQVGAFQVPHVVFQPLGGLFQPGEVPLDVLQARRHAQELVGEQRTQQQPLRRRVRA